MAVVTPGITVTRITTVRTSIGTIGASNETITKATDRNFDEQVASGATVEVDIAFAVAKLHMVAIDAAKNDVLTAAASGVSIKTNDLTTPGNLIPLVIGTAVDWFDGLDPAANKPITADVTKLYLINTGPVAVRVRGSFLVDAS